MTQHDARGLPVGSRSAAARAAVDVALWRMVSFYDTPLADLDAAIAADPGWALPHTMKAGYLASLTEASLLPEAATHLDAARTLTSAQTPARERTHLEATQLVLEGRPVDRSPLRRAGAAVGPAVGLLPRRRGCAAGPAGARIACVGRA
jgi:hypothetical protein